MKNQILTPDQEYIQYMVLSSTLPNTPPGANPMTEIIDAVSMVYGLHPSRVITSSQEPRIAECRFICMKILSDKQYSAKSIAEVLGVGRKAVHKGLYTLKGYIKTSPVLQNTLAFIQTVVA